jgi:hypothetical protein
LKNHSSNGENDNNVFNSLIKHIKTIPEINECEYIFIDNINFNNFRNPFLKNKIFLTQNKLNEFVMFENRDVQENGKITNMTKVDPVIVDLLILSNFDKLPKHIENIIDEDTIIYKNLGNDVIYIEDYRNNYFILITANEKIVIRGNGTGTSIKQYEIINT